MKVLYHHRTRAGDAQGIHIAEIQRAFRERGGEVVEVALVPAGAEARADADGGSGRGLGALAGRLASRLPLPAREALELAYNLVAYRRLSAAIRRERPDFLYERYAANTFAGLAAARRAKLPFVLEVNAPLAQEKAEHGGLFFARLTRSLERRLCAGADVAIAVTGTLRDILESLGVPAGKVVVMPNGVRRDFLAATAAADGAAMRERWGVPREAVLVGFVGWFRPWHGLERLLQAAAAPAWRQANLHLALVGDGPARPVVEDAARALGSRIVLCGTVPRQDIPAALAAFDVAVQPAVTPYACPMKIVEYMAAGRAIVAPGSPNVRELLDHGETAWLCPGGAEPQTEDLLEAVLTLVRDAALRRRLGEAARQRVIERGWLWEENARRVEELVAALPSQRSLRTVADEGPAQSARTADRATSQSAPAPILSFPLSQPSPSQGEGTAAEPLGAASLSQSLATLSQSGATESVHPAAGEAIAGLPLPVPPPSRAIGPALGAGGAVGRGSSGGEL